MIETTLNEIEAKIRAAESVSTERKRELLQLLGRRRASPALPGFQPRKPPARNKIRNHFIIRLRDCGPRSRASRNHIPNWFRS
jgi:hypothetical protein